MMSADSSPSSPKCMPGTRLLIGKSDEESVEEKHEQDYEARFFRLPLSYAWVRRRHLLIVVGLLILFIPIFIASIRHQTLRRSIASLSPSTALSYWDPNRSYHGTPSSHKPEGLKVFALVFFGRPKTHRIFECYLRKNLVSNGGWLDGVKYLLHTDDTESEEYLRDLVDQVPEYTFVDARGQRWMQMWETYSVPGAVMIKIDDDLVWMGDDTIPELVTSLLAESQTWMTLANLINSAALGFLHYHQGAIHSYLPERARPVLPSPDEYGPEAWKSSSLPTYQLSGKSSDKDKPPYFKSAEDWDDKTATYENHRWLPVRENGLKLHWTPAAHAQYDPFSFQWRHWQVAAQEHFSLLQNIEEEGLHRYHFGDANSLWALEGMRGNLNLVAIRGDDILNTAETLRKFHGEDYDDQDEQWLTADLPNHLERPCYISSKALASHFAFGPQAEIYKTDLLSRYTALANEKVCPRGKKIPVSEVWIVEDEKAS